MNCSRCDRVNLTEKDFYKTSSSKLFSYCRVCYNKRSAKNRKISRQKPENKVKRSLKRKLERQAPLKRAKIIARDSKASDKKFNREYDLTLEVISALIKRACCFCGESKLQMTLDRIDNSIGHTKNNVLPACIRCNLIRKAMPYSAWLCLLPGLKEAREKGLFGDWAGK